MAANGTNMTYAEALDQPFTLYTTSGEAVVNGLDYLQFRMHWGTQNTIISAVQVGAAIATLIGLLLITKSEKRRHLVYWLNALALALCITTQLVNTVYCLTAWFDPYPLLTGDFSHIPSGTKAISIFGALTNVLELVAIEWSLLLQTRAVCITLSSAARTALLALGLVVAVVAVALRFAYFLVNTLVNDLGASYANQAAIIHARDIVTTASIVFFSAVFVVKLAASIRQRRALGLVAFGPMQVILIGFTQTLLLPALFALVYFALPGSNIDQLVLTTVALSLPLTAMWASSVSELPTASSAARPELLRGGVVVVKTAEQESRFADSGKYGSVATVSSGACTVVEKGRM